MPVVTSKYKNVFKYLLYFKQVKANVNSCMLFAGLGCYWKPHKDRDSDFIPVSPNCLVILQQVSFSLLVPSNLRQKILCDISPKVLWNTSMGQLKYIMRADHVHGALKLAVWWPFYLKDKASVRENSIAVNFPPWKSLLTIWWHPPEPCRQVQQRELQKPPSTSCSAQPSEPLLSLGSFSTKRGHGCNLPAY